MTANNLSNDQLKTLLIEYLKREQRTQVGNIIHFGLEDKIGRSLNALESQAVLEMIHELIVSNILMTAMNIDNTGWPWLAVTTHGAEVLGKSGPPVYDYNGYMKDLKSRIPNLDVVVENYLSESLRAYQANLYQAAMVMLGCSSERAIRLLVEAYIGSIDDPSNQAKLRSKTSKRDMSEMYDRFKESFNSTRNQISNDTVVKDFEFHVDGVFTFIRLLRNSIVHPSAIPNITSSLAYANLQQFSYYITTVFALIEYYQKNKTKV